MITIDVWVLISVITGQIPGLVVGLFLGASIVYWIFKMMFRDAFWTGRMG